MIRWLISRSVRVDLLPLLIAAVAIVAAGGIGVRTLAVAGPAQEKKKDKDKPKLSLKASPSVAFSPARIYLVAEIKGGANDDEELYCASVEWDWDDGTISESSYDCDPYEAGTSEIRRRFAVEHVYKFSGAYQIQFRLKRKDKVLEAARTTVQVRPGLRDIGN